MTSVDAFAHYYAGFTRDQAYFEANVARLKTPVKVVWGAEDLYINKAMGAELADRAGVGLTVLPGVGHYPHLQVPQRTVEEIRAAAR
jgi:pimeloyl-ACP methyl ester carboxylesterase